MKTVRFIVTLLLVTLFGCAGSRQSDERIGFYHQKVSSNVYVIGYKGERIKNSRRANDFALLLAAEIGRQLGYSSFSVDNGSGRSRTWSTANANGSMRAGRTSYAKSSVAPTPNGLSGKPGAEMHVVYSNSLPKSRRQDAYVISDVIRKMKHRYNVNL